MYSQEHELTAVHETGHAVCAERFPPVPLVSTPLPLPFFENPSSRIQAIGFGYDEVEKRFDGLTACTSSGLSDEQLLFNVLGGKVAELMARTEGNWNITGIRTRILSGEFDDTQDMEHAKALLANLCPDNQNNRREQLLAETISQVFSFLKEHWDLVNQVASNLLSMYDPVARVAKISYGNLSPETKAQLMQVRDNR